MKFTKLKSAEQPTTPKPTTTLPDNMTWAWDPKANQWIAVMKDNPVVTPPTYNPNNITNTSNYTSTTYTPIKAANKEKTMQEYEDSGCDTTNLMQACQHIYYGFYDEIKNKWSPEKLLNYMEKRLDNAKNNPDEAKFEKNWATSRFPEAIELVKQFIENCNGKKEIKSTLIDSLNQFLDGDRYSREIKIEKGLISGGLIKLAGINPIRGPKYSITDKGLNLLKQAAQEEYDFEKDYVKARKSYLLDGISESEFKTGAPESQGQMPKFSIFEKDGSELAQIEAKNSTDAKAKFIMENPEYEGSQSIEVKEIDSAYGETTTQGLDFPNQSVSPSTDIKVNPNGWVNMAALKRKASEPLKFVSSKNIDFYIEEKDTLVKLVSEKLGVELDPKRIDFDYSLNYNLNSEIEWNISFETREYGIKNMNINILNSTINLEVEYKPNNESAPIQENKFIRIDYPLENVEIMRGDDEIYNSIWLKKIEIKDGYCEATF